jgi:hypothetical protein
VDGPRVYVFTVRTPDGLKSLASIVPPEVVSARGLSEREIVGEVLARPDSGDTLDPEAFIQNPKFVALVHTVVARHGFEQDEGRAEARRIGQGSVWVIDQRTATPQGDVPTEDIIGGFEVQDGQLVPGGYQPNPNYRLFTSRGFFQLGAALPRLLDELAGGS